MPFAAAVVPAPLLKLCPEYPMWSILAFPRASLTSPTNLGLVKDFPFLNTSKGPWCPPPTIM